MFSPSLTNEFVFGYTYIDFPNVFQDPKKVDRTALGYPYQGLYHNGVKQIPSFTGWGGEFAAIFNPGGFETGGSKGLFADKYLPSVSDNMTKVLGYSHDEVRHVLRVRHQRSAEQRLQQRFDCGSQLGAATRPVARTPIC